MCRLLLAVRSEGEGPVPSHAIFAAALRMSCGSNAHERPTARHRDGWGCIRADLGNPGLLQIRRSARPFDQRAAREMVRVPSSFLALHLRDATLPTTRGLRFTHPVSQGSWHLFHNGYLPQVEGLLGRPCGFDSRAYLTYLIDGAEGPDFDGAALLKRLVALPPGGTSANAFLLHEEAGALRVFVIHWFPRDSPTPRFYTLHRTLVDGVLVIASEICPELASSERWSPCPTRSVTELRLAGPSLKEITYVARDIEDESAA